MQDINKYSLAQLRKLEEQVAEELKKRYFLSVSEAREQIFHIARNAGISIESLLSITSSKSSNARPVAVKYRHPSQSELQWTGRGRQPNWIKAWIASGKTIEEAKV